MRSYKSFLFNDFIEQANNFGERGAGILIPQEGNQDITTAYMLTKYRLTSI